MLLSTPPPHQRRSPRAWFPVYCIDARVSGGGTWRLGCCVMLNDYSSNIDVSVNKSVVWTWGLLLRFPSRRSVSVRRCSCMVTCSQCAHWDTCLYVLTQFVGFTICWMGIRSATLCELHIGNLLLRQRHYTLPVFSLFGCYHNLMISISKLYLVLFICMSTGQLTWHDSVEMLAWPYIRTGHDALYTIHIHLVRYHRGPRLLVRTHDPTYSPISSSDRILCACERAVSALPVWIIGSGSTFQRTHWFVWPTRESELGSKRR